jgi:hypothetical protein
MKFLKAIVCGIIVIACFITVSGGSGTETGSSGSANTTVISADTVYSNYVAPEELISFLIESEMDPNYTGTNDTGYQDPVISMAEKTRVVQNATPAIVQAVSINASIRHNATTGQDQNLSTNAHHPEETIPPLEEQQIPVIARSEENIPLKEEQNVPASNPTLVRSLPVGIIIPCLIVLAIIAGVVLYFAVTRKI